MRIVNASPLIHLARVSLLELLRDTPPGADVVVPAVVFDEVMRGAAHDPSATLVEAASHDWLTVMITPPPHPRVNSARIDAGEVAVLSLALVTAGAVVVLDDRAARAEADRLGIRKTGTLRLLIDARQAGIIPSVRIPLERLRAQGMRLSDEVWHQVLAQAGE
jgi:predicted nucleic acid-binding protein